MKGSEFFCSSEVKYSRCTFITFMGVAGSHDLTLSESAKLIRCSFL